MIYDEQMNLGATSKKLSRPGFTTFFCGMALFTWLSCSAADNERPGQSSAAEPGFGDRSYVFIVDPWARQIRDYEAALEEEYPPPLGLLTIDALNIQVPIFNGTDEHILDRGAGRIKGMAKTGENGNLGISAHRDSFFRGLKDIELGEVIDVQTVYGVDRYKVTDINIVPKDDVSVLEPVDRKTLTLVTCYPFYHVGAAPERFIVTALPVADTGELGSE
jgi:LPXTG-site transpeptidase (sortase) family protein